MRGLNCVAAGGHDLFKLGGNGWRRAQRAGSFRVWKARAGVCAGPARSAGVPRLRGTACRVGLGAKPFCNRFNLIILIWRDRREIVEILFFQQFCGPNNLFLKFFGEIIASVWRGVGRSWRGLVLGEIRAFFGFLWGRLKE